MGLEGLFKRKTPERKPEPGNSQEQKPDSSQENQETNGPLRDRLAGINKRINDIDPKIKSKEFLGSRGMAQVLYGLANAEQGIEELEAVPLDVLGLRSRKLSEALDKVEEDLTQVIQREVEYHDGMERSERKEDVQ